MATFHSGDWSPFSVLGFNFNGTYVWVAFYVCILTFKGYLTLLVSIAQNPLRYLYYCLNISTYYNDLVLLLLCLCLNYSDIFLNVYHIFYFRPASFGAFTARFINVHSPC